jgi:hypothetical protein
VGNYGVVEKEWGKIVPFLIDAFVDKIHPVNQRMFY